MKKSEQVMLPASRHSAFHQRMAGSALAGLNNLGHIDAAVGIDVTKAEKEIRLDPMGRPIKKSENLPELPGMKL